MPTPFPVMAVPGLDPGISPGHPDRKSGALQVIGITGTTPVMTGEVNLQKASYDRSALNYFHRQTDRSAPS